MDAAWHHSSASTVPKHSDSKVRFGTHAEGNVCSCISIEAVFAEKLCVIRDGLCRQAVTSEVVSVDRLCQER